MPVAKVAIGQRTGRDATAGMCFLFEEADVFDDFILGHKPKGERADLDTNELLLNEIPCGTRYGFAWCITVPSAVVRFLPDSRHAPSLGERHWESQLTK